MAEFFKGVTPRGVALFPYLDVPDTKFQSDGEYRITLKLGPEDGEKLLQVLTDQRDKAFKEIQENPEGNPYYIKIKPVKAKKMEPAKVSFKMEEDDDGEETGFYLFQFKLRAQRLDKKTGLTKKYRPGVYDAKREKVDLAKYPVWGGSEVVVSYRLWPYYFPPDNTAGVSVKLKAVQVIKRNGPGEETGESMGFEEYDDGFDSSESSASEFDGNTPADGEDDGSGDF